MIPVNDSRGYILQLAGRGLVLLTVTYGLAFGGTFNGMLNAPFPQVSLALLTLVVIGWQVIIWRRPVPARDPLALALVAWGGAYALSVICHPSGRVYIGLWYAGLYAGTWGLLSDLRRRGLPERWFTDGALLAMLPLLVIALAQVGSWFPAWFALDEVEVAFAPPRPTSTLGNPNALGAALAMTIPLGLARAGWSVHRPDRYLWGLWLVAALTMLYLTFSRGAWLGTAAAIAVWAGLVVRRLGVVTLADLRALWLRLARQVRLFLVWGGVVGVVILAVLGLAAASAFDTPRRGTSERVMFWELAAREVLDHPLTGTGPFTFGLSLLHDLSVPPDQPHAHAHNLVLNVAAELGLLGLLVLAVTAALIACAGWRSLQAAPDTATYAHRAACGAALVAVGVHSQVDMPLMIPALMLLALGILAAGIADPVSAATPVRSRTVPVIYRTGMLVLWGGVLVSGWWSAGVYADYVRGQRRLADGDYQTGADLLRGVAEAQPEIALHHAEYGFACGLGAAAGDTFCLQDGIVAYEQALEMEAPHAVWWANLAALYWEAGQPEQAIAALEQATTYAPDAPDLWVTLGVYYEALGQDNAARDAYRRALESEPLWGQSAFWEQTSLRRMVLTANPVEPTPYLRAEAFWLAGDRAAAHSVLDREIARDPTQPWPYVDRARLYLLADERDRARDYLDAARLLVHTDLDQARVYAVEAEIALREGDQATWTERRAAARELVCPDETGHALYYGREIAYYQFLRVTVQGSLLPQLHVLGPDPVLIEALCP